MKIMTCPLNGPRNISEFVCAGEVQREPDPNRCSDAEWADYVFLHENDAGVVQEWWCHVPTAYWFIAERTRPLTRRHCEELTMREPRLDTRSAVHERDTG